MSQEIIFTKVLQEVSDSYAPAPASTFLPDWYKNTTSYMNGKKDLDENYSPAATIKKCIPVFDALTSGYIIPTFCDLWVKKNSEGNSVYVTSNNIDIQFHSILQAPYHPLRNEQPYPKWINPWSVKTPKGYSSLFLPPVSGGNKFFTIIEGFVDTDKYPSPVNFPFVLNDPNFEGLIPAGTPMVQVIPIKRENWKMKMGDHENIKEINETAQNLVSVFFDRYKSLFWNRKSYN